MGKMWSFSWQKYQDFRGKESLTTERVCSLKETEFSPTSYDQNMELIVFLSLWKILVKVE